MRKSLVWFKHTTVFQLQDFLIVYICLNLYSFMIYKQLFNATQEKLDALWDTWEMEVYREGTDGEKEILGEKKNKESKDTSVSGT